LSISAGTGGTTNPRLLRIRRMLEIMCRLRRQRLFQGMLFGSWSVSGASCSDGSTSNPCTFNMPSNGVTIIANFNPAPYSAAFLPDDILVAAEF